MTFTRPRPSGMSSATPSHDTGQRVVSESSLSPSVVVRVFVIRRSIRLTTGVHPRRLMIAPAGVGCNAFLGSVVIRRSCERAPMPLSLFLLERARMCVRDRYRLPSCHGRARTVCQARVATCLAENVST